MTAIQIRPASHPLVSSFAPPGDIHRVHNTADEAAVSIHKYRSDVTRVGSSARRYDD